MLPKPPSDKQLALIVQLAEETGTTLYKMPSTAEEAMNHPARPSSPAPNPNASTVIAAGMANRRPVGAPAGCSASSCRIRVRSLLMPPTPSARGWERR